MSRRPLLTGVLLAILPALPAGAGSEEDAAQVVIGTRHSVQSRVMGEERGLLVSLPPGYAFSEERYPVLYLLDGGAHFHHATGVVRFLAEQGRMPQVIVVGVGNTNRTRDLTPPARDPGHPAGSGGADRFLRFLAEELIPAVDAQYRTLPYRVLMGHSFGGLFAVHALMRRPEAFRAYVAASPSLWWNDRELVRGAAAALAKLPEGERALYFTMGAEGEQMLGAVQALSRELEEAKPQRLSWRYRFLEEDDHGTTPHRTLYDGLEFVFSGWRVSQALLDGGDVGRLEAHYAALTRRFGFEVKPREAVLNGMGYQLLGRGRVQDAIAVFRRNVQLYGGSANAHDSLGEALEAAGQLDEAISSYRRACERGGQLMDPNTPVFKEHLDRALLERSRKR